MLGVFLDLLMGTGSKQGLPFQVELASGRHVEADRVVLCLGNEKSLWPCATEEAPAERLIGNPWAIGRLLGFPSCAFHTIGTVQTIF